NGIKLNCILATGARRREYRKDFEFYYIGEDIVEKLLDTSSDKTTTSQTLLIPTATHSGKSRKNVSLFKKPDSASSGYSSTDLNASVDLNDSPINFVSISKLRKSNRKHSDEVFGNLAINAPNVHKIDSPPPKKEHPTANRPVTVRKFPREKSTNSHNIQLQNMNDKRRNSIISQTGIDLDTSLTTNDTLKPVQVLKPKGPGSAISVLKLKRIQEDATSSAKTTGYHPRPSIIDTIDLREPIVETAPRVDKPKSAISVTKISKLNSAKTPLVIEKGRKRAQSLEIISENSTDPTPPESTVSVLKVKRNNSKDSSQTVKDNQPRPSVIETIQLKEFVKEPQTKSTSVESHKLKSGITISKVKSAKGAVVPFETDIEEDKKQTKSLDDSSGSNTCPRTIVNIPRVKRKKSNAVEPKHVDQVNDGPRRRSSTVDSKSNENCVIERQKSVTVTKLPRVVTAKVHDTSINDKVETSEGQNAEVTDCTT
ncbi:unnamed protein product, partial [Didymodactylos carnosus]